MRTLVGVLALSAAATAAPSLQAQTKVTTGKQQDTSAVRIIDRRVLSADELRKLSGMIAQLKAQARAIEVGMRDADSDTNPARRDVSRRKVGDLERIWSAMASTQSKLLMECAVRRFCVFANHGEKAPPKKDVAHHTEWAVTDLACSGVVRGPEKVEESLPDLIVGPSGAARGGDGLGTVVLYNLLESHADFAKSIVPRDLPPFVFTAGSGPLERGVESSGVIEILHHISPARAAFGNGVGRFRPRERLVRLNGEETISFCFRSQSARIVALHANDFLQFH